MRRRRERGGEGLIEHPVLAEALLGRR
jgi:hypothetical protein